MQVRIRVSIERVHSPSQSEMWMEAVAPLVETVRNFFLYMRLPYDRNVLAKFRDWRYLLFYYFAVSPNQLLRGGFFTVYLACILVDREEYQLMRFIISLKGTQVFSGLIKAISLCHEFWMCTVVVVDHDRNGCIASGPGVGKSVPANTLLYIWLQALCWTSFLLLPFAGKAKPDPNPYPYP